MADLLTRCSFPALGPPYAQALHDAVELILQRYSPIGIIAAGSILLGKADKASDLDVYVIHSANYRQRLQRFFSGVPAEIFINPPRQVEQYFAEEHTSGRPITAHMLANGFVVLSDNEVVEALRVQAREWLSKEPSWSETQLLWCRYAAGNEYEDGLDLAERDPSIAQVFLSRAVTRMLEYFFMSHGLFIPRAKELLAQTSKHDPLLGYAAQGFFSSGDFNERLRFAEQIADATIQVHGFFEWESAPEEIK